MSELVSFLKFFSNQNCLYISCVRMRHLSRLIFWVWSVRILPGTQAILNAVLVTFHSPFKTNFGIVPQLGHGSLLPNPFQFITPVILLPGGTVCSRCWKRRKRNHDDDITTDLFLKFKLRAIIWILTATYFYCPLHLLRFLSSVYLFIRSPRVTRNGVYCATETSDFFLCFSFLFSPSPSSAPLPNQIT